MILKYYYNSRKYIFFVKILTVDLCNNEVAEQWKDLGEKGHIYMDSDGYLKLSKVDNDIEVTSLDTYREQLDNRKWF